MQRLAERKSHLEELQNETVCHLISSKSICSECFGINSLILSVLVLPFVVGLHSLCFFINEFRGDCYARICAMIIVIVNLLSFRGIVNW